MKRLFIICMAIMSVMTVSGCRDNRIPGGEHDAASAKISVQAGCILEEREELTGGAVKLREWLNGFETEPVKSVPDDERLRYTIALTFGMNPTKRYEYLDCGDEYYLCSGNEWFSVENPSPIPVGYAGGDLGVNVWGIVKVEYAHCAEITELDLSDKEKMTLSEWLCGLKYERREFAEGETPGDSEGGEAYSFTFEDGGLSYINNGGNECYLLFEGEWYAVLNPSKFPVDF
ncbi:MAG: hypothetical protein HDT43_06550 [Ruminococcaceae bacterium]|nr:hypothetical protein [Oscillospiraceae bacterium]